MRSSSPPRRHLYGPPLPPFPFCCSDAGREGHKKPTGRCRRHQHLRERKRQKQHTARVQYTQGQFHVTVAGAGTQVKIPGQGGSGWFEYVVVYGMIENVEPQGHKGGEQRRSTEGPSGAAVIAGPGTSLARTPALAKRRTEHHTARRTREPVGTEEIILNGLA
jgi:hypothetical protein